MIRVITITDQTGNVLHSDATTGDMLLFNDKWHTVESIIVLCLENNYNLSLRNMTERLGPNKE
jgi:hypothetical protein